MAKARKIIKAFIYLFLGYLAYDIAARYIDFLRYPEKYEVMSAPWYTASLITAVFTFIFVLILVAIYLILGRILKKRSAPTVPNSDSHKWETEKALLKNGEITVIDLIRNNAKTKLYYSTPAGQDSFGNERFWILENESGNKYYPTFSTIGGAKEFFEKTGRHSFMLIEGDLKSQYESLSNIEIFKEVGIVIDPHLDDAIEIPYNIRL